MAGSLRKRLESGETLLFAGTWDPISSAIVEASGFDGLHLGSYTFAGMDAVPDACIRTPYEATLDVLKISSIVKLPILVDGEQGWGDPANFAYWVRQFESSGADAIHLDDRSGSVICPWVPGCTFDVQAIDTVCGKIRAGTEARRDRDFLIFGRTASLPRYGLEEAIKRAKAFRDAGADVIMAPHVGSLEKLKTFTNAVGGPIHYQIRMQPDIGDDLTRAKVSELASAGVQIVSYATGLFFVYVKAVLDAAKKMKAAGTQAAIVDQEISDADFLDLIGMSKFNAINKKHGILDEGMAPANPVERA